MATNNKNFTVDFDMKFSHELNVTAKTKSEANKKAIAKFLKKLKASDFNIYVDER